MSRHLVTDVVRELDVPSPAWREAARELAGAEHATLAADCSCLRAIEAGGEAAAQARDHLRIVAWNAERLKHVEASAAVLRPLDADVLLLTEVDRGMARSGNRHTAKDLAEALGMGWRFAVEFVELGLGNAREHATHQGELNIDGLHGAAILSRVPLTADRLIRLDDNGAWFDGMGKGERRVGGRIALAADVGLADTSVRLAAVHLESHSDAKHRAAQTATLIQAISGRERAVLAGDFNSKEIGDFADAAPPSTSIEPLFAELDDAGLHWRRANAAGPTQRLHPYEAARPLLRLDWIFVRGLRAKNARTVPARGADGVVLSDHEILVVDLDVD